MPKKPSFLLFHDTGGFDVIQAPTEKLAKKKRKKFKTAGFNVGKSIGWY